MIFADTFFFLALLNPKDRAHRAAVSFNLVGRQTLTTQAVLTELADAMSWPPKRKAFLNLHLALQKNPEVEIVPWSEELFHKGVDLFAARNDKDWSLTDCISFSVMRERGITEALTGDQHFEQAGFVALLKGN